MAQQPELGLINVGTVDPTAGAGVPGLPFQFYFRSTNGSLYIKSGDADTAWTAIALGGGGEVNTASNLAGGTGIFAGKTLANLAFKSLVVGSNLSIANDANTITISTSFAGIGSQFLGDGSDGALVFDGVATVLGIAPATAGVTSPYNGLQTYTLTRDIFATSIAISANVVVVGATNRVWCTGNIAGPGKIARNGNPGVTATTSAFAAGGSGASSGALGGLAAGGNGGSGGNPNVAGVGGGAAATGPYGFTAGAIASTPITGNNGTTGGIGQGGSGGSSNMVGGAGGAVTLANSTNGQYVQTFPQSLTGRTGANVVFTGGSGGGGGAGGLATSGSTTFPGGGGGGGGGGGPLVVAARSYSGGVSIEARGGNGGNGAAATAGGVSGGGCGGAGGAGSWLTVLYADGNAPTVNVAGGTGGTGGAGSGGGAAGTTGGNGGVGMALIFDIGA